MGAGLLHHPDQMLRVRLEHLEVDDVLQGVDL
jgi:hypothetical protein